MKWLVENTINSDELIKCLKRRGSDVEALKKFGYTEDGFKIPDEPFIGHGSIGFAKAVKKGFMFDEEAFRCRSYYEHYKKWLLVGDEFEILKAKDLQDSKNRLFKQFGADGCIFIKPDTNDKIFSGQVTEFERYDRSVLGIVANNQFCDVIVSRPWNLKYEWRLFIANGEVVTGSQYRTIKGVDYKAGYPSEAARVASEAAKAWTPHPMLVIDVCQSGDDFCVLEIGCWNVAGYYKSDLNKIIDAAEEIYESLSLEVF